MRYLMQEQFFSVGDVFHIKDEEGREVFSVKGAPFRFGHQLTFYDMAGNELAFIRQKLPAWRPTYEVYRQGQRFAVIQKALFSFFRHVFSIAVPGVDDLRAEGNIRQQEWTFQRGGQTVARVSRQWFQWNSACCVEVAEGEDDVLILASAIGIDRVRADAFA